MSEKLAKLILSAFCGRPDIVAVATDKGFEPYKTAPNAELLKSRHLAGKRCLGFYLMTQGSQVCCSCVDFDNKPNNPDPEWKSKASALNIWLQKVGLHPLVEVSASGNGAHVWIFLDIPTDAWIVRAFWKVAESKSSVPFVEVYPRQDELSGKGMGNLVRYPLWGLSCFVDDEWEQLEAEGALSSIRRVSGDELRELAASLGTPITETRRREVAIGVPPRVAGRLNRSGSLLARRWGGDMTGLRDQSRSALCESIACELVRQYVPTEEISAAIRHWCREHDYDKGERSEWIRSTVAKAYDYTFSRTEERSADLFTMQDACLAYIAMLEKGEITHLPSGIEELDASIEGVAPGEVCVIGGRPSHGKSLLALQWLDSMAAKGVSSLLISEEMSKIELGKRGCLYVSGLPQEHWGPETAPILGMDVRDHYKDRAPIHVVESCYSIERAETVIDQCMQLKGVKMVAVDYLQLLSCKSEKLYEEVTAISKRLKQAAKRNNVALLLVCQLNREIDKRPDRKPKLADFRDSGQIEQDADVILVVQWPHRFDPSQLKSKYLIFALKRRNGRIVTPEIETVFDPERQRIGSSAEPRQAAGRNTNTETMKGNDREPGKDA